MIFQIRSLLYLCARGSLHIPRSKKMRMSFGHETPV